MASTLSAALEWEITRFVHEAAPGEQMVTAVFPFTNGGNQPITIRNMQSTCGCTVAELEKRIYAPGESGEIKAVFSYGGRMGRQMKQVRVTTSDRSQPTVLEIDVTIPTMVEINPRILYWRIGQDLEPRSVMVRLNTEHGVEIREIVSQDPSFTYEMEATGEAGVYTLTVFPPTDTQDNRRRMGRLDLHSNVPAERPQVFTVFLGLH
ncbi:MAG: DUF1573 domain-containing protein [Opitutales bacterium]|nr:DUF1573 domain-containing protein [Opitutales bacterium]